MCVLGVRGTAGRNDTEKIFTARWKGREAETAACHGSRSVFSRVPVSTDATELLSTDQGDLHPVIDDCFLVLRLLRFLWFTWMAST